MSDGAWMGADEGEAAYMEAQAEQAYAEDQAQQAHEAEAAYAEHMASHPVSVPSRQADEALDDQVRITQNVYRLLVEAKRERNAAEERARRLEDGLREASERLGELTRPPWLENTPLIADVRDNLRALLAGADERQDG